MKLRQRGGYVLPMVMVVLMLLGLLTATCYGAAVHNYESQRQSLERAQRLFTAKGQIEQKLSALQGYTPAAVDERNETTIEGLLGSVPGTVGMAVYTVSFTTAVPSIDQAYPALITGTFKVTVTKTDLTDPVNPVFLGYHYTIDSASYGTYHIDG